MLDHVARATLVKLLTTASTSPSLQVAGMSHWRPHLGFAKSAPASLWQPRMTCRVSFRPSCRVFTATMIHIAMCREEPEEPKNNKAGQDGDRVRPSPLPASRLDSGLLVLLASGIGNGRQWAWSIMPRAVGTIFFITQALGPCQRPPETADVRSVLRLEVEP